MRRSFTFQTLLVSFGIALLFAGLFFDVSRVSSQPPMPTPDRLAQPTLPANPSQADKGAQVYWLSCMPCHGERGQGLTEEFIQTYPEEDRNCWKSGCHGERPYEKGFTLPKNIPAVIGAGTLQKFPNALILQSYIDATMPYWKPGLLTEEESWQVAAFLLRENHLWAARNELNAENAGAVLLDAPLPSPQPNSSVSAKTPATMIGAAFALLLFLAFRHLRKK